MSAQAEAPTTPGLLALGSSEGLGFTPPALPRVLDPCSGSRMMWFDRQHPDVIFGDCRSETLTVTDNSRGNASGTRTIRIEPDTLLDFRALPYPDGAFKLVAFDPPHLVSAGPRSWLAAKYGRLSDNWRDDLRAGFSECFRVLASDGVLVFKWNETQIKVGEVLALTPHAPLFGHPSGKTGGTHWLVFMKPNDLAKLALPANRTKP
jgi:SAM-dependent methyltransferase